MSRLVVETGTPIFPLECSGDVLGSYPQVTPLIHPLIYCFHIFCFILGDFSRRPRCLTLGGPTRTSQPFPSGFRSVSGTLTPPPHPSILSVISVSLRYMSGLPLLLLPDLQETRVLSIHKMVIKGLLQRSFVCPLPLWILFRTSNSPSLCLTKGIQMFSRTRHHD